MDVFEAIRTRRSIGKVTGQRPSGEQIETMLEAGAWAPNHHLTHPWRFVVIAGDERGKFGDDGPVQTRTHGTGRPFHSGRGRAMIGKALRAQVIIAVGVEPAEAPKVIEIEEIESGAAAVQNMLLAAHAMGLATICVPGMRHTTRKLAGISASERGQLLGFIYVGYAAVEKGLVNHVSFTEITRWRGWID